MCVTPLVNTITNERKSAETSYRFMYVGWPYGVRDPYCFLVWSKVICGQQRSSSKNLVNMITSDLKGAETSYSV